MVRGSKGLNKKEIAGKLYREVKSRAVKLNCNIVEAVIYHSPLEELVLKENNYKQLAGNWRWEIYPGNKVQSKIYYLDIDDEKDNVLVC